MEERKRIWVCAACGKTAADRYDFSDESCFLCAVECYEDTLEYDKAGRVIKATAFGGGRLDQHGTS